MAKKILLTSFKGGTGVTTCAVGLGRALAASGERTLIVDGDLKSGCAAIVGECRDAVVYTLADYEKGACRAKQTFVPHPTDNNLLIMPTIGLKNKKTAENAVKDVEGLFDYIFFDKICENACDSALIVTDPYVPSIKSADVCRSHLADEGISEIGLIVNKTSAAQILNGEIMTAAEISTLLHIKLRAVIPEDLLLSAGKWRQPVANAFKTAAANISGKSENVLNVLKGFGGINGFFRKKLREKV